MATWYVSKQEDGITVQGGSLMPVKRVTYTIEDNGETGTLEVPMARYTPELVAAMVADAAAKHVATSQLRGEV